MVDLKDPWQEIQIKSWKHFDESIGNLKNGEYLFRGQSDKEWDLTTSLDRSFQTNKEIIYRAQNKERNFIKKAHEDSIIKSFMRNANLFLKFLPPPNERLEWLAIMQHYGAPTRLLDVTLSPHVATFFALESGISDSCVFAIKHTELKEWNSTFFNKNNHKKMQELIFEGEKLFISVFNCQYGNERQVAQQGLFLVPSQIDLSVDDLLKDYQDFADHDVCIKYIIPANLRFSGLERLKRMNITSATLFPGIDGFAKSLRFQSLESIQTQRLLE